MRLNCQKEYTRPVNVIRLREQWEGVIKKGEITNPYPYLLFYEELKADALLETEDGKGGTSENESTLLFRH